jgi:L-alanine-DL-glutamate epimerase-like enolase superfamily enzyme
MIITSVETLTHPRYPVLLWIRIETDEGIYGIGETLGDAPAAVARIVHERLAPALVGHDPTCIEHLWDTMVKITHYHGHQGAEMRAISAIDIALWDILGKITGQPCYTLLGGACRDRIPTYNTCANFGDITDHTRFTEDPAGLAKELLASGISAMKIWPFDRYAPASQGQRISDAALAAGVAPFEAIRNAVGDAMDIALEGHCCWNLPSAIRIAQAVEPWRPMWIEELMPHDNEQATKQLHDATRTPMVSSERIISRFGFRRVIEEGAADIIMLDINWTGGLTEAKKIAALASTWMLPLAPHNPGGPISHLIAAHFSASVPNLFVMESVRAHYLNWFNDIGTVSYVPDKAGQFPLPPGPGLGIDLRQEFMDDPAIVRERSGADEAARAAAALSIDPVSVRADPYETGNTDFWRRDE